MKLLMLFVLLLEVTSLPLEAALRYTIVPNASNNTVTVSYTNRFFEGVCTVEGRVGNRWIPLKNFFTLNNIDVVTVALPPNNATDYRLRCVSVAPGNAFTHLAQSYGKITTIAGNGGPPAGTNWPAQYEGAIATEVSLSNPTSAMADSAGNVYIANRDGHAVLKVTPEGRIYTAAGTHQLGLPIDNPFPATNSPLNSPTTLHIVNNRLYILDSGNSRIRVLDSFGNLATVGGLPDPTLATNLAGLWVVLDAFGSSEDEIFYGAGTTLKRYTLNEGFTTIATNFLDIGSVVVNPIGRTIVTDVPRHRVYRTRGLPGGPNEVIAGTGFPRGNMVGKAETVALPGARSVWYLPIGGYFVGLDYPSLKTGARVWYVDSDDNAAPFIFGAPGVHAGDGAWFQKGRTAPKISTVKSVSVAPSGDIILVEGNGFVRKIEFLRREP